MKQTAKEISRLSHMLFQKEADELTSAEWHGLLANMVMQRIQNPWQESRLQRDTQRCAYYFSAEFLVGRAVWNNLLAVRETSQAVEGMKEWGVLPDRLEEIEDAALGNGGLGRLAACFLDSAATLGLPLDGYGIRYRYGLFRQRFIGGFQTEEADDWTRFGDPWSVRREEEAVTVSFRDGEVKAVPYDMPIIGYRGKCVRTLRLWQGEATCPLDFDAFNRQQYDKAVRRKNRAEDLSRVLYPNDSTPAGRLLRLKQQYFFTSASMQDLLRRFEKQHGQEYERFPDEVTVQLNDTHPVLAIPEWIRLMEQRHVSMEQALEWSRRIFHYTNHTIMPEALEKWDLETVAKVNPAIAHVIRRLANHQRRELSRQKVSEKQWPQLLLLQGNTVHMAYLACFACGTVNGVAQLHTEILKHQVLAAWHKLDSGKIQNKTNGVTQRRWLALCNPALADFLTERLGSGRWITDLSRLKSLSDDANDPAVLQRFTDIKRKNKQTLQAYIRQRDGLSFDPQRLLDVQIKRLHEYKRQLLNILCILELYFEWREGTLSSVPPTTFLFGAKAAPGYLRAKGIIKLIHAVGDLIAKDIEAAERFQVIFVSNYDVSYAEKIVAAADVSEQISTAGTEASGTGNMKLMMNGAVTLGTYDGANVEIVREVGEENAYIFGARVEEINAIRPTYRARDFYERDYRIQRCLDALVDGTLDDGGTGLFRELYESLLDGADWHAPDAYFLLLDFDDCLRAKKQIWQDYGQDPMGFAAKQWRNVCASGYFSSDRTVREYARKIWHI